MLIKHSFSLILSGIAGLVAIAIVLFSYSQSIFFEGTSRSEKLDQISGSGSRLVQLTHQILLYGGDRAIGQWHHAFDEVSQQVKTARPGAELGVDVTLDVLAGRLTDILPLLDGLVATKEKVANNQALESTLSILSSQVFQEANQLQATLGKVKDHSEDILQMAYQESKSRHVGIFSLFAALASGYGILVLLLFRRFILKPLEDLGAAIQLNREGEAARAPVQSEDEIGDICRTFNDLLDVRDKSQREVRQMAERLHIIFESANTGIAITLPSKEWLSANAHLCAMLGYEEDDLKGLTWAELTHPDDINSDFEQFERMLAGEIEAYELDKRFLRKSGQVIFTHFAAACHRVDSQVEFVIVSLLDITARKEAEDNLRLYANVFQHSGEAIMITDDRNRILTVNQALTQHTGYELKDIMGEDPKILASGHTPRETYQSMWASLNESGYWQGELWDRRKDGDCYPKWAAISVIRGEEGEVTHHIASFTDISERKAAEARIDYLAHHDALTGLFNRYNLESRLGQALLSAKRENEQLAVMFIDMDRFKVINDTLGHHVGDEMLKEIARRLSLSVRESDIVARLGGDEFVVVLTGIEAGMAAAPVASKILHTLGQPYDIDGKSLHSTPSIGISVFPTDGEDAETLMKNADTAMYHAKEQGRNNTQFFAAAMTIAANERMELEHDLRRAIRENEFELHYQPQVCTIDSHLCGVEALVRWRHPERGLIPPLKFIPIAEDTGLIEPLGEWVLGEACRQLAIWRRDGVNVPRVAINISAHQLRSQTLVGSVKAKIEEYGLKAGEIELEITESAAMADPERAIIQLRSLRGLGVDLAIDDFGTGYSSLAYLKLLPIQTLKLDRTFVRDIETDSNDAAISAATLALAKGLGLLVVAEGVETEAQRRFLALHECDTLQGYLFGKPEPAAVWEARWRELEDTPSD